MPTTVAVIGAGPLGLAAVKNFTEAGFDVTGFDARDYLGGLWKYSTDDSISVQKTTVFNSSRYRSAFSDFPFGDDVDDFPTWQQFHKYITDYADHFDVSRKVQLSSKVENVDRVGKKWVLTIKNTKDGSIRTAEFDKVAIANGYFTAPNIPKLDGIEKFKGRVLHSIQFHTEGQYKDKNVLIVGLHATSADVTTSLVGQAKNVWLSHRNGLLMLSKYASDHKAFDTAQTMAVSKVLLFLMSYLPNFYEWLFDKLVQMMSKASFPNLPSEWKFSPAPPAYITNPVIADDLYKQMEAGWAIPVPAVRKFTGPKSVEFTDGTVLDDIDCVIYCTGYHGSAPMLKGEYNPYPVLGEQGNFYRNLFLLHPDEDVRNSLCFIGHGGFPWPGLSMFELQSAAVAQIWLGNAQLPPLEEMKQWHADLLKYRKRLFAKNTVEHSTHYPAMLPTADAINWLDRTSGADLLSHFGWSWKAWKFWWQDRSFYKLCSTGVLSPHMWRLFDTGGRKVWPGARAAIERDNRLVEAAAIKRKAYVENLQSLKKIN